MTDIIRTAAEMSAYCRVRQADGIGFVPTMGALHAGHAALLKRARDENTTAVASIFVNPTQYDDPGDLENYPRTFEADLRMLEDIGIDAVFFPSYEELYPMHYRFRVTETRASRELEGAYREGHFDGVLSVVLKLLLITRPTRAYFGEKDEFEKHSPESNRTKTCPGFPPDPQFGFGAGGKTEATRRGGLHRRLCRGTEGTDSRCRPVGEDEVDRQCAGMKNPAFSSRSEVPSRPSRRLPWYRNLSRRISKS